MLRSIRASVIALITLVSGFLAPAHAAPETTQLGVAGQPIALRFSGPIFSEDGNGNGNPFLDWRVMCTIQQPDGVQLVVPGFFAGDGNAAHTHARSGRVWLVRFTPAQAGRHYYSVALHEGPLVGIDTDIGAGLPSTHPLSFHGKTGSFAVAPRNENAPGFLGKGMLRYIGEHYLQFDDGSWFIKAGADSPENLLAFSGFDATTESHHYNPHANDWVAGDPDWTDENGDSGKNIIGALNYLASMGMNSTYFLTMNVTGDGNDTWPWTAPNECTSFDISKLAQWEIVFSHMDRLGIQLHVVTQETENDQLLDGGALGVRRKVYYKELVARFAHHNAISWNLGEENSNTAPQRWSYSDYIAAWDVYDHPISVHHYPHEEVIVYSSMLGHPEFDGTSLQLQPVQIHAATIDWIDASRSARHRWVVCHDEQVPGTIGTLPDSVDFWHNGIRKYSLWGNLIAGGGGVEFLFGVSYPNNDLTCEDWRSRDQMWRLADHALDFFHEHLPFSQMKHADQLVTNGWCFAQRGEIYAIYLPNGGTTTLDLPSDTTTYSVRWYDPRHGGALAVGTVRDVTGPGSVNLGNAPNALSDDWAILVTRHRETAPPVADAGTDQRASAGDTLQLDGAASYQPGSPTTALTYHWDFGDGAIAEDAGSTPVHSYTVPGVYEVILTVSNGTASDQATCRVAVGTASLAVDRFDDEEAHEWIGSPNTIVSGGRLELDGGMVRLARTGAHGTQEVVAGDVAAEAEIQLSGSGPGWGGIVVRREDGQPGATTSGYLAFIRSGGQLTLHVGGVGVIASTQTSLDPNSTPVTLRVEAAGDRIKVFADDVQYLNCLDTTFHHGHVALAGDSLVASFDDFRLESLAPFHTYGMGETSSTGPLLVSGQGMPTAGGNFRIQVNGLPPSTYGLLIRSTGPEGAATIPWPLGDWFGLTAGASRLSLKVADPAGQVEYDYSELAPGAVGEMRGYQYWSRDGGESVLSNAVRVTFR